MTQSQRVLKQLWFLTSVHVDLATLKRHPKGEIKVEKFTRTFGYKWGFESAMTAIRENHMDMHECLYNYLVMERIGEGIHALTEEFYWFRWSGRRWTPCETPEWARGITNWALG